MDEPAFLACGRTAMERVLRVVDAVGPPLSAEIRAWMDQRAGASDPILYFLHPLAFPTLRMPWWADGSRDLRLQCALMEASIAGYYYIRILDDMMDGASVSAAGPGGQPARLLPAASVFLHHFESCHHGIFPSDHAFWADFASTWNEAARVTFADAQLRDIGESEFLEIAGRKTHAVHLPLLAIFHARGQPSAAGPWLDFATSFGRWHQLYNDTFDWSGDHQAGVRTWFLCEAERRSGGGSMAVWALGDGLDWAQGILEGWLDAMHVQGSALGSPDVERYLESRRIELRSRAQAARSASRGLLAATRWLVRGT